MARRSAPLTSGGMDPRWRASLIICRRRLKFDSLLIAPCIWGPTNLGRWPGYLPEAHVEQPYELHAPRSPDATRPEPKKSLRQSLRRPRRRTASRQSRGQKGDARDRGLEVPTRANGVVPLHQWPIRGSWLLLRCHRQVRTRTRRTPASTPPLGLECGVVIGRID